MASRQEVLGELIREHGWTRGAELGVYQGQTLFYLLDRFPDLAMIGVDRWERTPGPPQNRETGFSSQAHKPMEFYCAQVKERASRYGERATILHAATVAAAPNVTDASLDFVFIDASHDTQSVLDDIAAWLPKVNHGGALLGHDINWPSVRRAVDKALPEWAELDAHVWYARRP